MQWKELKGWFVVCCGLLFHQWQPSRSCGLGQEEQNNSKLEKALGDDDGTPSWANAKKQCHIVSQYITVHVQDPSPKTWQCEHLRIRFDNLPSFELGVPHFSTRVAARMYWTYLSIYRILHQFPFLTPQSSCPYLLHPPYTPNWVVVMVLRHSHHEW